MYLTQVIHALRDRDKLLAGNVAGALEWKDLERAQSPRYPAAYVVPLSEDASENESQTDLRQTVTNNFGVILLLEQDGRYSPDVYSLLELHKRAVFKSILNWTQPPVADDEFSEIVYEGGALIYADGARIAYQLEFSFESYLDVGDGYDATDVNLNPAIFDTLHIKLAPIDPSGHVGTVLIEGEVKIND